MALLVSCRTKIPRNEESMAPSVKKKVKKEFNKLLKFEISNRTSFFDQLFTQKMAENKRRLDMPKTCQKTAKILAHAIVPELNHLLG